MFCLRLDGGQTDGQTDRQTDRQTKSDEAITFRKKT
jgi:hypothetical protein